MVSGHFVTERDATLIRITADGRAPQEPLAAICSEDLARSRPPASGSSSPPSATASKWMNNLSAAQAQWGAGCRDVLHPRY
jgi:hypothetical protein